MTTAILLDCERHSNTRHGMRHVFLALAAYATPHGPHARACPSLTTIAAKARLSVRQVGRCLKRLINEGHIRLERGASRYGTNLYTLFRPWRIGYMRALDKTRQYLQYKDQDRKKRRHLPEDTPCPEPRQAKGADFLRYLGLAPGGEAWQACQP